jgi:hypothetical protein
VPITIGPLNNVPAPGDPITSPWAQAVSKLAYHPMALATRPITQNHATGAWVPPSWSAELRDTANLHDIGTNPMRFTIPAGYAGLWLCTQTVDFSANGTGRRGLRFTVNGAAAVSYGVILMAVSTGGGTHTMSTVALVPAVAGDYIEGGAFQDSGATLTIGGPNTMMGVALLGAD